MIPTSPVFSLRRISARDVCAIAVWYISMRDQVLGTCKRNTIAYRELISSRVYVILIFPSDIFLPLPQRLRQAKLFVLYSIIPLRTSLLLSLLSQLLEHAQAIRKRSHYGDHTTRDVGVRHIDLVAALDGRSQGRTKHSTIKRPHVQGRRTTNITNESYKTQNGSGVLSTPHWKADGPNKDIHASLEPFTACSRLSTGRGPPGGYLSRARICPVNKHLMQVPRMTGSSRQAEKAKRDQLVRNMHLGSDSYTILRSYGCRAICASATTSAFARDRRVHFTCLHPALGQQRFDLCEGTGRS